MTKLCLKIGPLLEITTDILRVTAKVRQPITNHNTSHVKSKNPIIQIKEASQTTITCEIVLKIHKKCKTA